jgi:glucose/arabinose dehydrogenase
MRAMKALARVAVPFVVLIVTLAACGAGEAAHSTALRRSESTTAPRVGGKTETSAAGKPAASAGTAAAGRRASGVRLVRVANFEQPLYVTAATGDARRLYVVQRTGRVMLLLDGHKRSQPFLDLSRSVTTSGSEQGLLGLAFAPDYVRSGLFYVDYTSAGGDIEIVQYRRSASSPNRVDPVSARTVLRIEHHTFPNHNGGQLAFGPEGDLYIGVGDGGSEDDPDNNGQNTDTPLGKILRIAPKPGGGYTIPSTNPFVGQAGKRPEIWAYGLRNPWRFSFDRTSGAMIIGDVGQDQQEEVDLVPAGSGAGANYGWSVWEGDRRNKPGTAAHAIAPTLVASHSDGYCAIIGGYVVRDRSLPSLYGRYLFGDYCRPKIESVEFADGKASGLKATGLKVSATSSLGEDARGRIYITSLNGPLYRIAAAR